MMFVDIRLEILGGKHSIQLLHKGLGEKKKRRKEIKEYISLRMSRNLEKIEQRKLHRGSRDGEGQGTHQKLV